MNRRKAITGLGALLGATAIAKHVHANESEIAEDDFLPAPKPADVRHRKVLNNGWQFIPDMQDIGEKEQWFAKNFDSSKWAKVNVAQPWDTYEEALWEYEGIAWYTIAIDPDDFIAGKRNVLKFNRVMFYSKVWLNGDYVGENIGGYLPFEFDITRLLKAGQKNILTVRVDNKPRIEWLPGGKQIEWIQYGGILEKVELTGSANTWIEDCTIRTTLKEKGALVSCIVTVMNETAAGKTDLEITITRGEKKLQKNVPLELKANETTKTTVDFLMEDAALWSPETPVLYYAKASIKKDAVVTDDMNERFGIREISVKGTGMLLNGKPLYIKGVNRYDDYAKFGPSVPEKLLRKDLAMMKRVGINFIRMHYPQSADLLSLYDEYGFIMMEEIPLCWWGINFFGDTLQSLDILKFAKPELAKMVARDKNHPCIIIWSMANECGTNNEIGITAMRDLLKQAKSLDPTRLVTFVASQSPNGHLGYDEADIVCVNKYNGIFSQKVCKHISDIEELGYKPFVEELQDHRRKFTKPIFIAEFGCAGIKTVHGDTSHTEEFQSAYIERIWQAIGAVEGISGGVLWCWADYYHRKYHITYAAFGPYGVVTTDRRTKHSIETLTRMYRGTLPLKK